MAMSGLSEQMANNISTTLENKMSNKRFAIADLVSRLEKIAMENRYDQVSRIMHEVYEKKMDKNPELIVSSDDIKKTWSSVYNLNPQSEFKDKLEEVFEKSDEQTSFSEGSPFRIAGFEEDYRPTPTEVVKSEEEIIKDASFSLIRKVASGSVTNPQYHFGQFVKVPQAGRDSGVALWTLAFNTGKGYATVSVPVNVVNGHVNSPEVFYAIGNPKAIPFTSEELRTFANSFSPELKPSVTEHTGFDQIGTSTVITDRQDIKEASEVIENNNISLAYSVPIDESLTSNVGHVETAIATAIANARTLVEGKVKNSNKGSMNVNLQISYSGALGLDGKDIDPSQEKVEGVFAFNASQNTRNGLKTITIPVVLAGNKYEANSFYSEKGQQELNASNVLDYFANENTEVRPETSSDPTQAFSDAFLAYLKHDATYGEIIEEIKANIYNNQFTKAATYLDIISSRFGDKALKAASENYIQFVREASAERKKESVYGFFTNANVGFRD